MKKFSTPDQNNLLTPEMKLQIRLDLTYIFCQRQKFKRYETLLYMQAHCKTDTQTIVDYLTQKENDLKGI